MKIQIKAKLLRLAVLVKVPLRFGPVLVWFSPMRYAMCCPDSLHEADPNRKERSGAAVGRRKQRGRSNSDCSPGAILMRLPAGFPRYSFLATMLGEVAERSKAAVLKTVDP